MVWFSCPCSYPLWALQWAWKQTPSRRSPTWMLQREVPMLKKGIKTQDVWTVMIMIVKYCKHIWWLWSRRYVPKGTRVVGQFLSPELACKTHVLWFGWTAFLELSDFIADNEFLIVWVELRVCILYLAGNSRLMSRHKEVVVFCRAKQTRLLKSCCCCD